LATQDIFLMKELSSQGLLGCDTMQNCSMIPTFWRSLLPPSSGCGILPQHYTISQLRRPQIFTAMKTSDQEASRHNCIMQVKFKFWGFHANGLQHDVILEGNSSVSMMIQPKTLQFTRSLSSVELLKETTCY